MHKFAVWAALASARSRPRMTARRNRTSGGSMQKRNLVTVAFVSLCLSACSGDKALDRPKAMEILSHAGLNVQSIEFTSALAKDCLIRGQIARPPPFGMGFGAYATESGKQYLQGIDGTPSGGIVVALAVHIPVSVVGITGITDQNDPTGGNSGASVKTIDFTAKLNFAGTNYPLIFDSCLNGDRPFSGHATMRLYDDGWRIVSWVEDPVTSGT
jgi:hypothetical protein